MGNSELISEIKALGIEASRGNLEMLPEKFQEQIERLAPSVPVEDIEGLLPTFHNLGIHIVPSLVCDVVSKLLEGHTARTICDPRAGLGFLLAIAKKLTSSSNAFAFNSGRQEAKLGRSLLPEADWKTGDATRSMADFNESFDLIVSYLPLTFSSESSAEFVSENGMPVELVGDWVQLLIAESANQMSDDGLGVFVVSESFFLAKHPIVSQFSQLGIGIEAVFCLEPGMLAPFLSRGCNIVVVRKRSFDLTFVAQLTIDSKTNSQILCNFKEKKRGGVIELGCLVDIDKFRGFDALSAGEYIEAARKNIGFPDVALEDLTTEINVGRSGTEFRFSKASNGVFVPLIGQSDVVDSMDRLTLEPQDYAQIVVDPSKSQGTFIARFLNSELGKKMRDLGMSGTTIPKLDKQTLKSLRVFIPDLAVQRKMLEIEARLSGEENTLLALQNDLAEMRCELWRNPNAVDDVDDRLSEFSTRVASNIKEQAGFGLDQWSEAIPFPLASILRAWQTTPSADYKTKHEHLLHFFEATAEFISVIFLSAFSRNEGFYSLHKEKLKETMAKQHLSFHRATFGSWKLVVEYFGKQTRLLLQERGKKSEDAKHHREICASMFADSSLRFPGILCSKDIASVLGATNKMRNDWVGHGGVVGQAEAKLRNEQLIHQVEKLRHAMSDLWDSAVIVNALHCKPRNGVFENEIAVLKGSNSEFMKESRAMHTWLDVDRLYLINGDQGGALKLLPLVQVGPSPATAKNACYFFNRTEREGARFVSYHFAGQPELLDKFQDATDAIKLLTEI